ncbi:hypothetical protein MMC06_005730 [Schaereria dolodes]|nr:hypothetical protein [Schaereria dolodes]
MVTFTESLFPRTPSVREWTNEKQIKSMAEDKRARFITITEDGQITAYAKWLMPTNEKDDSDDPSQVPSWPEGVGRDFDDFHLALARKRKELMGERPYYQLELLATLPEHQGRGAGGKLIRWGLEQADRDGLATYVEAFAAGVPVYEHFGWKNLSKVVIIGGHFAEFCMVRPAPDGHE